MKKIIGVLALAALAIVTGCGKVKNLADINVDIPYTTTMTVPQGGYAEGETLPLGGVPLPFPAIPVPTNSKQYMDQYHTAADKITSVTLKNFSLQLPDPKNFNFLDTIRVYLSANGLPEVALAYQYPISKGLTTLELTTSTSVNLKDYFLKDTMYFRLDGHMNAVPPSNTTLTINSTFHLLANPLN